MAEAEADLEALAAEILHSKKYRSMGLSAETVRDVLAQELASHARRREAVHAARQKLHNIAAPYLGDPDYDEAEAKLAQAYQAGNEAAMRQFCEWILGQHASTAERLPHLEEFYEAIFAVTGKPQILLDLACGLNPFALPWMGLPAGVKYHAYDIHGPRLALINRFLECMGLEPLAHMQDVIACPVEQEADAAFLLKEAHRFEQRRRGVNRGLWAALPVRWLAVSLPASGLSGRHDLSAGHRALVHGISEERGWPVMEIQVGDELIFCIDKSGHG